MKSLLGEILEGDDLTAQEIAVLEYVAAGATAEETGREMFLAPETVKSYRKRIIAKLGARNGSEAVAIAMRRGLIR